jgi:copper oxidase (laccase) domain-containing protein
MDDKSASLVKTSTSIVFKPGFENKTAEFEIFQNLPIKTGFSWGNESGNMSYKWNAGEESPEEIYERVKAFMKSVDATYPGIISMPGAFEGPQEQIKAVDSQNLGNADETEVQANFIYTFDPNLVIAIRPADCNISIIYGKTHNGREVVGLIHSSAIATNAGIPRLSIRQLIDHEDVDLSSIRIGITPGISRENYFIEKDDYPIIEKNWKENIDPKVSGQSQRRYVNILNATIMQYLEEGIEPPQIEAYEVNTYTAMQRGESFSHRLYEEEKAKGKSIAPGRYMVVVQLDN